METAEQARAAELTTCLGGITIPSRLGEGERIRRKHTAGLDFFTTQVLFDSNDIVWLIQQLNGVEARVFLSFAPVTLSRDIQFLRWLGERLSTGSRLPVAAKTRTSRRKRAGYGRVQGSQPSPILQASEPK